VRGKNKAKKKAQQSGAIGNTLNNHQRMGSLRMFGARGLLLIFIALGTNGQLLSEKIPLGKVLAFFYGNFLSSESKETNKKPPQRCNELRWLLDKKTNFEFDSVFASSPGQKGFLRVSLSVNLLASSAFDWTFASNLVCHL
jgi:hypothetical protein